MIVPGSASPLLASAGGYNLTKSLRFRGSSVNASLTRTPASTSNRRTWTWSGWVKLGSKFSDGFFPLFGADATGYPCSGIALTNFNIQYFAYTDPTYAWQKISTMVLRDPSAWYHIVAVTDTTNGTAEDRARVYVNGQRVTSWSTNNNPSPSYEGYVNSSSYITKVGRIAGFDYFDGYMSEVNFVDGLALDPSSFGETSTSTGVWIPKKYVGTYGTNGFYLDFEDNSSTAALGYDAAGSNDFTVNNISLTAGSTYDSMTDVPTLTSATAANYATVNPLNAFGTSASGNLNYYTTTNYQGGYATMAVAGKIYFEVICANPTGGGALVGFVKNATIPIGVTNFFTQTNFYGAIFSNTLNYYLNGSSDGLDHGNITDSMLQFAVDRDTGKCWVGSNNTWFDSGNPATGANPAWTISLSSGDLLFPAFCVGNSTYTISINFGQRPFSATPPTGFKALNTFNLTTPTITQSNKNFDVTTFTGNASTNVIVNSGLMQPDMVWLKSRTNANNHTLYDSIRGVNNILYPSLTNEAATGSAQLTAFNSNGFTLGASENSNDSSGELSVGWQWKESASAGFDIITYTGNGGTGASSQYVNHSLGVTPNVIITKVRSSGASYPSWYVYHSAVQSGNFAYYGLLNSVNQWSNGSSPYQLWTANTTQIAFNETANEISKDYVAYVFAQVAGYSAMGSYTGNGLPDGTFVYTGFRPKFVMVKASSFSTASTVWTIFDTSRSPYNASVLELYPNDPIGEQTDSNGIDILSNGFKPRRNSEYANSSGQTYIYMAFAENPFKYSNAR